ncbi:MAG: DEAD/DEAH box helicase [Pirellulaceae bacterium]
MNSLRPHQQRAVELLRDGLRQGFRSQLLTVPTGGGKTRIAAEIVKLAAEKGHVTLFVVDRIELATQAADTFRASGLTVSIMQGENTRIEPGHDVVVGSIQTLARRRLPEARLVIIDEAHILHRKHIELMARWDAVPVIGLTATPFTCGLGRYFTRLVVPTSIRELTNDGHLVPIVAYGPSSPDLDGIETRGGDYAVGQLSTRMQQKAICGDLVGTWRRLGEGRQTIAFCVDIAHAKHVAAMFTEAGIPAAHVDGYMDSEERRDAIARFKAGEIRVLASVAVLSIGFDAPVASCAILARPTKSLTLHLQQVGRVLRPHPESGKVDALILDHSGNIERHGLPADIAIGELDRGTKTWGQKLAREPTPRPCPKCAFMKPPKTHKCPMCGFAPERQNGVEQVGGELVALTAESLTRSNRRLYQEFLGAAIHFDKRPGWAFHLYLAKTGDKPAWGWRNLAPVPPSDETLRYARSQMIRFAKGRGRAA